MMAKRTTAKATFIIPDAAEQISPDTQLRVFLSHATADKWIAIKLCNDLESIGISVFRDDRDIDGGDDIPETIRHEILNAHEIIVLVTPQSLNRNWVQLELGAAWGFEKRIVLVLHYLDDDPLPPSWARRKAIQLNDFNSYLDEAAKRAEDMKQ